MIPLLASTTTLTVYLDDADHDRLPDTWELAQFGTLDQGGLDDFDSDTYDNRSEFVFGSLAAVFESMPRGPKANGFGVPGAYRFELMVRNDLAPDDYKLYVSDDLGFWTLLGSGDFSVISTVPVDGAHDLLTLEVVRGGDECFLKAGVD